MTVESGSRQSCFVGFQYWEVLNWVKIEACTLLHPIVMAVFSGLQIMFAE